MIMDRQTNEIVTQETNTLSSQSIELFYPILSTIDTDHIRVCPCHSEQVNRLFQERWNKELATFAADGVKHVDYVLNSLRIDCYVSCLSEVVSNLPSNTKCPLEIASINASLLMFDNSHYDLSDPVVFSIVKNALNVELNNFRLQLLSKDSSLLRTNTNEHGDTKWELNPTVEASRKSSDTIIRAMQILSNIVDGQKTTNINVNVDAIKNVWQKRKDMTQNK